MKALDVIPLLTPEVIDRIEAVVQSKPKRTESYRWSGTACRMSARGGDSAFIWSSLGHATSPVFDIMELYACYCVFWVSSRGAVFKTFPMWSRTVVCPCVYSAFPDGIYSGSWYSVALRNLPRIRLSTRRIIDDPGWYDPTGSAARFLESDPLLCCVSYVLLVVGVSSPVLWTDKPVTIGVLGNVAFGLLFKSAIAFVHSRGRFRGTIGHRDPPWTTSKVSYQQQPRSSFQGVCKWRFPLDIVSSGGWHQRPQQFAHPFRYEHEYETSRIDTIATEQKGEKPTLWATMLHR